MHGFGAYEIFSTLKPLSNQTKTLGIFSLQIWRRVTFLHSIISVIYILGPGLILIPFVFHWLRASYTQRNSLPELLLFDTVSIEDAFPVSTIFIFLILRFAFTFHFVFKLFAICRLLSLSLLSYSDLSAVVSSDFLHEIYVEI